MIVPYVSARSLFISNVCTVSKTMLLNLDQYEKCEFSETRLLVYQQCPIRDFVNINSHIRRYLNQIILSQITIFKVYLKKNIYRNSCHCSSEMRMPIAELQE